MQIRHQRVGWISWYVVYGVTGQDPQDEGNVIIMDYLAEHVRSHKGLWIAAGDWNMKTDRAGASQQSGSSCSSHLCAWECSLHD